MLTLKSNHSVSQLIARWDDRTSPARFAGNDDVLDTIYRAKREEDRVYLIHKGSSSIDPFTTVFRGKISRDGEGSVLEGKFTKRVFDYVLLALFLGLDIAFAMRSYLLGDMTPGGMLGCGLFALLMILLAIPTPWAKKRYTAFLRDITRED